MPGKYTFVIEGERTIKGSFPWHVGIYKLNDSNQYEQRCGGSMISRNHIVSAAHCFTKYENGAPDDTKLFAIAAGKYYRNYYEEKDILSQKSTVKKIIIPERFKGLMTSFTADIALVILDKALEITRVVQPVCIDWNNEYEATQLRDHNKGLVVGWGYTNDGQDPSAELKQLSVPYINFTQCYKSVPNSFTRFLTNDKFCAGFANGSTVCHGDSGGGLVFKKEDTKKYYLRGLVSVGPLEEGKCDSRQYVAYTKVSDYMLMLRDVEVNSRLPVIPLTLPDGSCALPPQPANGNYTVERLQTIIKLTYSCTSGYQIYPYLSSNVAICYLDKWYSNLLECVRKCGPRISDSVDTDCEYEGIKVDCSKPMIEDTTVQMNCKHRYSQTNSSANLFSACKDGSWNRAFIECEPECGNVVPKEDVLIIGGNNVKKGTFPWHVGIYRLNSTNQFEQSCGGSIISRKVIISAAHCFTNYADGKPYDVKQYAIGAGKYYRNYYDERDTLSQTSTIKEIIIPRQYKAFLSSFMADIAFLTLDKALEITHVVQPVCIDWNQQYEAAQLKDNNIGTIVGWGHTKEGQDPSAELQELSVPFVNFETCLESVPETFIRFLTPDKFCAGFANGSSVCHGDTGGGLAFLWPDNKKYYLRGLVSIGPLKEGKCDSRQYATYTRVSEYMETLRAVVANTRV